MTRESIVVQSASKRFRVMRIPKRTTLKEAFVKRNFFTNTRRNEVFVDAVHEVTFSVAHGSMLGILGRNGSGKSTLMRLLAGIYKPDSGTIKIDGNVAPLLSLGLGFHPDMSGRENVRMNGLILGLSPRQIDRRLDDIIDFAELRDYIDVPVRMYSSGMYMRLAFAVAVSVDPDVLLLDEVMAVGDGAFVEKCLERMRLFKRQGKTIVLVTHDTSAITEWCDSALWIDEGRVRLAAAPDRVADAYALALAENDYRLGAIGAGLLEHT
jgi:lipopolysaccharide transport system ATP-binding protein